MVEETQYAVGEILRDKHGLEWIVLEHDRYFPDEFPGLFLIYRHANMLSIGDRRPIESAANMQRTGYVFPLDRINW